jgi:hypothetical protein
MATVLSDYSIAAGNVRQVRWSEARELSPSAIVLVVGLLMTVWLYITPAYVPDEVWFRDLAADKTASLADHGLWTLIRTQDNQLGYGAIYWIVYAMLGRWFVDPIVAARWLAFASMASVPACAAIYAWRTGSRFGWLAVLLWFTFPMCWWTGKLTGPETYSLALSTIGVTTLLLQRGTKGIAASGTLLGLAIGIKLTAIPVLVFATLILWQRSDRRLQPLALLIGGLLLGFLIANPFLLSYPEHFVINLKDLAHEPRNHPGNRWSLKYLHHLFSNSTWEWDCVYRGGFFNWGLGLPALLVWCGFLWRSKAERAIVLSFAVTLLFGILLLLNQSRYLGWYWFPIVALLPLVTCAAQELSPRETVAFASALVLLNLCTSLSLIHQQWQTKSNQLLEIADGPRTQHAVEQQIRAEFPRISRLSWCLPPGVVTNPTGLRDVAAADDFHVYWNSDAYRWIHQQRFFDELPPGHSACIVMHRPYRPVWQYLLDQPGSHVREQFQIREVALDQEGVDLVFLRRR